MGSSDGATDLLQIPHLSLSPKSAAPGDSLQLSWTIENFDAGAVRVRLHVEPDDGNDGKDLSDQGQSGSLTLNAPGTAGSYRYLVKVRQEDKGGTHHSHKLLEVVARAPDSSASGASEPADDGGVQPNIKGFVGEVTSGMDPLPEPGPSLQVERGCRVKFIIGGLADGIDLDDGNGNTKHFDPTPLTQVVMGSMEVTADSDRTCTATVTLNGKTIQATVYVAVHDAGEVVSPHVEVSPPGSAADGTPADELKIWAVPTHARRGEHVRIFYESSQLALPGMVLIINNGQQDYQAGFDLGTKSGDPWEIRQEAGTTQTFVATLQQMNAGGQAAQGACILLEVTVDEAAVTPIKLWTVPTEAGPGEHVKLFYQVDPVGTVCISNGQQEFRADVTAGMKSGDPWVIWQEAGKDQPFTLTLRDVDNTPIATSETVSVSVKQVAPIRSLEVRPKKASSGEAVGVFWLTTADSFGAPFLGTDGTRRFFVNDTIEATVFNQVEELARPHAMVPVSGDEGSLFPVWVTVKDGETPVYTSDKIFVGVTGGLQNVRVTPARQKKGGKVRLTWDPYSGPYSIIIENQFQDQSFDAKDWPSGTEWLIHRPPGELQSFVLILKDPNDSWREVWRTDPAITVQVDLPLSLACPSPRAKRDSKVALCWDNSELESGQTLWMNNGNSDDTEWQCSPIGTDGSAGGDYLSGGPDWTLSGDIGSTMTFILILKDADGTPISQSNPVAVEITDPNDDNFADVDSIKAKEPFVFGFGVTSDGTTGHFEKELSVVTGSTVYVCCEVQHFMAYKITTKNEQLELANHAVGDRQLFSYPVVVVADDEIYFEGIPEPGLLPAPPPGVTQSARVTVSSGFSGEAGPRFVDQDAAALIVELRDGNLPELSEGFVADLAAKSRDTADGSVHVPDFTFKAGLGPYEWKWGEINGEVAFTIAANATVQGATQELQEGDWNKNLTINNLAASVGATYSLEEPASGMTMELEAFHFEYDGDEVKCAPFSVTWAMKSGYSLAAQVEVTLFKRSEIGESGTVTLTLTHAFTIDQGLEQLGANKGRVQAQGSGSLAGILQFHPNWEELGIKVAEKAIEDGAEEAFDWSALELGVIVYVAALLVELILKTWSAMSDYAAVETRRDGGLSIFMDAFRKSLIAGTPIEGDGFHDEYYAACGRLGGEWAVKSAKSIFEVYLSRSREKNPDLTEDVAQGTFNRALRSPKVLNAVCDAARAKYAGPLRDELMLAYFEKDYDTNPSGPNNTLVEWYVKPVQGELCNAVDVNGYLHPQGYIHSATVAGIPPTVLQVYLERNGKIGLGRGLRYFVEGRDGANQENLDNGISPAPQMERNNPHNLDAYGR